VTPLTANGRAVSWCKLLRPAVVALALLGTAGSVMAAPPKIRTDAGNVVPRCVTPKRLMAFLRSRNGSLDRRFADIAAYYRKHGETWHVRWDYAFFQMTLETNFLTYRRGNGGWGDVDPKQNNFAGLGTTGGGVPGDSYPDVSTGVLAQIQHLVVYSGERIDNPVGARTRLKQDDIIEASAGKKGAVTFSDLARRWAADRHYGTSIEWVASSYRQMFCKPGDAVEEAEAPAPPKPVKRAAIKRDAKQEMARAANLGGPLPVDKPQAPAEPPVRTVWSATDAGSMPAPKPQQRQEAPRRAQAAPLPTRKPIEVADAGPVVAEQILQTGSEPTPPSSVAAVDAAAAVAPVNEALHASDAPAPSATAQGSRLAFASAAALGAARPTAATAPQKAPSSDTCSISSASYGGKKVLLVRTADGAKTRYTVLTVLEGFEKSLLDSYLKAHAPGGSSVGEFTSKDAALAKARELCSRAASGSGGASAG